jgi:hypothetical protein
MSESGGGAKPASKIFDVSHPGKSAPSSSAKPIIVTNRPVMKDPMMVDEEASEQSAGDAPTDRPLTAGHLKIEPLSDADKAEPELTDEKATTEEPAPKVVTTDSETITDKADKNGQDDGKSVASPQSNTPAKPLTDATDKATPPPKTDDPEPAEPAADADSDDSPEKPSKETSAADQEALDKQALELQQLTDSHKYYLPIDQIEKRKAKRYAWAGILLIILLAVAWADVSLDAGILTIPGVKAPTHFFSN